MNVAQVEQARLFVNGNYVALLILGQTPDENTGYSFHPYSSAYNY